MASINFDNVTIDFPVFSSGSRSIKNKLLQVAIGGKVNTDKNGVSVVRALDRLSFSLNDGERVALLGRNGAGKSSLLRVLNGVYKPTVGEVNVVGSVGSLIDINLGIDLEASGLENIYIRARLLGMSSDEIKNKIPGIIEFSELGEFVEMPVRTYSSGMQMRLAFAVSTTAQSNILLMDEWLSVGDESFKNKAEIRMQELLTSTDIVVIATHSKELILNSCSRAIWLEKGEIRMDGDVDEVCSAYFDGVS
jgi:lipopolysaccharide transport system ATP-binding protein